MKKSFESFIDQYFIRIICGAASGIFIAAYIYYARTGATLLYGDARSRLLIARRVIDSLTPGLTQLGSVWPPLPQLLSVPTIWNNFFFYSGLSGSLTSIVSAIVATCFLAKIVLGISKSKLVTLITVLSFVLNPSFLYMATTPMTEPLFISLIIIATYYIWKWSETDSIIYLPLAGLATLGATLTRYDGWFFAMYSAIIISVVAYRKRESFSQMEGTFLLFATVAFSGIIGWLLYNQLIFGNMFRFAAGEGSALSQLQSGLSVQLTRGNIINSSLFFLSASALNVGILSLFVTLLASILVIIRKNYNFLLIIVLLSAALWFNILSLFLGQSELITGQFATRGLSLFNVRFGLTVLPLIALGYGIIAGMFKRFRFVLPAVLLLQLVVIFFSPPITLKEATDDYASRKATEQQKLASWIQHHPTSNLTLISSLSNDSLIFDAHIPTNKVVNEGSGVYWKMATDSPNEIVNRIILSPEERDSVYKISEYKKNFFNDYTLVYTGDSFRVYDLAVKNTKSL